MLPPYPAAMPGAYNTEVIVQRGYWMVNWFRREFGQREELQARAARHRTRAAVRRVC